MLFRSSDGWNWYNSDRVQFVAGREAELDHRTYLASSHPVNEQFRTSSHHSSKHACTDRSITNSGAPAVSQQWAAMVHTPTEELSEEQTLLLKTVQAEDIFSLGGQRDQGVHEISSLNSKLPPTSEGLPDPRVQQALLHPEGSEHSPFGAPGKTWACAGFGVFS